MSEFNEEFDKLRTKVLRYALYKKRTEKEIREKFINENQAYIDEIIEFLIEDKYLNEEEYVEAYFYESTLLRNQSIREIQYKLSEKGINRDLIEKYISVNTETLIEYEIKSALALLEKRKDIDANKNISYLLNKGYTIDNIKKAIDKIEEEDDGK